jgi:hypothetical protein
MELEKALILRVKALPDSNGNSVRRGSARLIIGRWIQKKHYLKTSLTVKVHKASCC